MALTEGSLDAEAKKKKTVIDQTDATSFSSGGTRTLKEEKRERKKCNNTSFF